MNFGKFAPGLGSEYKLQKNTTWASLQLQNFLNRRNEAYPGGIIKNIWRAHLGKALSHANGSRKCFGGGGLWKGKAPKWYFEFEYCWLFSLIYWIKMFTECCRIIYASWCLGGIFELEHSRINEPQNAWSAPEHCQLLPSSSHSMMLKNGFKWGTRTSVSPSRREKSSSS